MRVWTSALRGVIVYRWGNPILMALCASAYQQLPNGSLKLLRRNSLRLANTALAAEDVTAAVDFEQGARAQAEHQVQDVKDKYGGISCPDYP